MKHTGIHPDLNDMVKNGQLSAQKLKDLVRLRGIVDRFATNRFVSEAELVSLREKFGHEPGIVTWGDYFQTEVASRFFHLSDDAFARIVDTVRFDLIAARMIFAGKSPSFFDQVEEAGLEALGIPRDDWSQKEEEAAHMRILKQYYLDMGLADREISRMDREWFEGFVEETNAAAG